VVKKSKGCRVEDRKAFGEFESWMVDGCKKEVEDRSCAFEDSGFAAKILSVTGAFSFGLHAQLSTLQTAA
jgi:hypothetical protein